MRSTKSALGPYASALVREAQLATFRDSTGHVPAQWPTVLLPSVTAIIRDRRYTGESWRVLVHERSDNVWWGFPGGAQHPGESILETVVRETKEETGVDITVDRLVAIDSDPLTGALCSYQDGVVQYTNLTFVCWYTSGQVKCSSESLVVRWCTTEALPAPFLATHRWRLEAAKKVMDGGPVEVR